MSNTIKQLSYNLDIELNRGNDFARMLDFNQSLAGYTFTAPISDSTAVTAFTITGTDLSTGKVTLSLTDTQTNALPAVTSYKFSWTVGTNTRDILYGKIVVK
jgi:hypothetical protein